MPRGRESSRDVLHPRCCCVHKKNSLTMWSHATRGTWAASLLGGQQQHISSDRKAVTVTTNTVWSAPHRDCAPHSATVKSKSKTALICLNSPLSPFPPRRVVIPSASKQGRSVGLSVLGGPRHLTNHKPAQHLHWLALSVSPPYTSCWQQRPLLGFRERQTFLCSFSCFPSICRHSLARKQCEKHCPVFLQSNAP